MNPGDLLRLSLSRLGTGKVRTALTMLGIIIGVASVVALVSVAQGATKGISDRLQSLGTNLVTVSPGFTRTGATRGAIGSATTLTLDDAADIDEKNQAALLETSLQLGFVPILASVKPQVSAHVAIDLEGGSGPNGIYIDEADWKYIRRHDEVKAVAADPEAETVLA